MDLVAMQTLAVSRQLAFSIGFPAPGFLIRVAAFPPELFLATLLDATFVIVVVGIGCPALPIHLALQPTDVLLIRGQLLTEQLQARLGFSGNQGDGRGSQVGSD